MTNFVLDPNQDTVASVPRSARPYQKRQYRDKQFLGGEQEWAKKLNESTTVYIGNLSCYTNEYQLHELFSRCGSVKRIIMGLDRFKKQPCGFCFVVFDERSSALKSIKYLNQTHLDGRNIQVDMDAGFQEGRQFGRGQTGGQIGDERRRERESGGGYANRGGANFGSGAMLTRSITVVACLAMISLALVTQYANARTTNDVRVNSLSNMFVSPYNPFFFPYTSLYDGRYLSINRIRQAQVTKQREQLESDLAQFLVNLMKASKPTLMKAFIKATLADKQLKEIAIALFFGGNNADSDESNDKESDDDKDEDNDSKETDKVEDKKLNKETNVDKDKEKPSDKTDEKKNDDRVKIRKRKRVSKTKTKE